MYKKKWTWMVPVVVVPVILTTGYFFKKNYISNISKEVRDVQKGLAELPKTVSGLLDDLHENMKERVRLEIKSAKYERERGYRESRELAEEYREKLGLTEDEIKVRVKDCDQWNDEVYKERLEEIKKQNRFIFEDALNEVNSE